MAEQNDNKLVLVACIPDVDNEAQLNGLFRRLQSAFADIENAAAYMAVRDAADAVLAVFFDKKEEEITRLPMDQFWVTTRQYGKQSVDAQMKFLNEMLVEKPEMVFIGSDPEGHYIFQSIGEAPAPSEGVKPDYPYASGDFTVLGPECFTNGDVISYRGENYYRGCDRFVADLDGGGQSFCIKPVKHGSDVHEDMDGRVRVDPDE